jgi:hypothetical protein
LEALFTLLHPQPTAPVVVDQEVRDLRQRCVFVTTVSSHVVAIPYLDGRTRVVDVYASVERAMKHEQPLGRQRLFHRGVCVRSFKAPPVRDVGAALAAYDRRHAEFTNFEGPDVYATLHDAGIPCGCFLQMHIVSSFAPIAGDVSRKEVVLDEFGNPVGSDFDLNRDGTFEGDTVCLWLAIEPKYCKISDFAAAIEALQEKGFRVLVFDWERLRCVGDLRRLLDHSGQLWILSPTDSSDIHTFLTQSTTVDVVRAFLRSKRGVYLWADNFPFFKTAQDLAQQIVASDVMLADSGNPGCKQVGLQSRSGGSGFVRHAITTSLKQLYEGATISHVRSLGPFRELMRSSKPDEVITAVYERDGERCCIDGGFTRLYVEFRKAGTARFVKNSACWLAVAGGGRISRYGHVKDISGTVVLKVSAAVLYGAPPTTDSELE